MSENVGVARGLAATRYGQVHFRTCAGERPIVLFHINQQSSAVQVELMQALAPEFQSFAMDYPSYGMSDHVSQTPGIDGYAECAAALLDMHGIEKAFLLGEAAGSAVAAAFAGLYPARALGVVLLNCPLMPNRDDAAQYIMSVRKTSKPTDATGFPLLGQIEQLLATNGEHMPLKPTQSWMDRINVALAECGRDRFQVADAVIGFDLKAALSALRCPTLLLTAEHGPFAAYRADAERCIAGVRSHVVPECRFGMAWEQAGEVASHVKRFARDT